MTYSIIACDATAQQFGVAVQPHPPAVGVGVPGVKAGGGAIATQSATNAEARARSHDPSQLQFWQAMILADE